MCLYSSVRAEKIVTILQIVVLICVHFTSLPPHSVTYLLPPPSAPFFPRKGKKKKNHELIECKDLVLFTFVF